MRILLLIISSIFVFSCSTTPIKITEIAKNSVYVKFYDADKSEIYSIISTGKVFKFKRINKKEYVFESSLGFEDFKNVIKDKDSGALISTGSYIQKD